MPSSPGSDAPAAAAWRLVTAGRRDPPRRRVRTDKPPPLTAWPSPRRPQGHRPPQQEALLSPTSRVLQPCRRGDGVCRRQGWAGACGLELKPPARAAPPGPETETQEPSARKGRRTRDAGFTLQFSSAVSAAGRDYAGAPGPSRTEARAGPWPRVTCGHRGSLGVAATGASASRAAPRASRQHAPSQATREPLRGRGVGGPTRAYASRAPPRWPGAPACCFQGYGELCAHDFAEAARQPSRAVCMSWPGPRGHPLPARRPSLSATGSSPGRLSASSGRVPGRTALASAPKARDVYSRQHR